VQLLRVIGTVVALAASGLGAVAQAMKPAEMSQSEAAARRFPQPVRVGDLVGRTVLQPLESQPVLGHVERLVRAAGGGVQAVVRYGGVFGIGGRPIAVPVEAMVLLGEYMEIVDFTPAELDRFPTAARSDSVAVGPDEIIRVGLAKPSH
jgi:hypothetical protein